MKRHILFLFAMVILSYSCSSINAQKGIPQCIQDKITELKKQPLANPPISVYQYHYNDKLVYYISAPCCDRYTTLYDESCTVICRPSGGITGKGDGKCSDFFEKRTDKKLLWKDTRKSE